MSPGMERDRDPYGCESDQPGHEMLIVLGQGHREEERQRGEGCLLEAGDLPVGTTKLYEQPTGDDDADERTVAEVGDRVRHTLVRPEPRYDQRRETEEPDDALLLFHLDGRTIWSEDGSRGGQSLRVLFESEDDRFRWLNDALCVLEGVVDPERLVMVAKIYVCRNELLEDGPTAG